MTGGITAAAKRRYRAAGSSFAFVAILLSHGMCAHVAYAYCDMLWGIAYAGYSAPANIAFLLAIPYMLGILAAWALANHFWRKAK